MEQVRRANFWYLIIRKQPRLLSEVVFYKDFEVKNEF